MQSVFRSEAVTTAEFYGAGSVDGGPLVRWSCKASVDADGHWDVSYVFGDDQGPLVVAGSDAGMLAFVATVIRRLETAGTARPQ